MSPDPPGQGNPAGCIEQFELAVAAADAALEEVIGNANSTNQQCIDAWEAWDVAMAAAMTALQNCAGRPD